MEEIKAKTMEQEKQLQDVNMKAAELIERQTQLAQNMLEVKNLNKRYKEYKKKNINNSKNIDTFDKMW